MESIYKFNYFNGRYGIFCCLFILLCYALVVSPLEGCEVCNSLSQDEKCELDKTEVDIQTLGELSDIFSEFVLVIEGRGEEKRSFFLKHWCKKAKKWLVKRVYHLFKEVVHLKCDKSRYTKNYAAYMVAKFQRDMSKYYETGEIKDAMKRARKEWANHPEIDKKLEPFFKCINYYSKHKKERPTHPNHDRYDFMVSCKYDQDKNYLEGVPIKAAFGTVEAICGALIFLIPVPGCQWVGQRLMIQGGGLVVYGYYEKYFEEEKPRGLYASDKRGESSPTGRVLRRRAAAAV